MEVKERDGVGNERDRKGEWEMGEKSTLLFLSE